MSLFFHFSHIEIDLMTVGLLLMSTIVTLIPEELLFVILGIVSHFGRIHPLEAILAAQFGLIPADTLTVWLGRRLGNRIIKYKPFCYLLNAQSVHRSLEKFRSSGGIFLFFTRFTPMLRTPVYLAAGISGISIRRSTLIDLSAACIQVPAFFLLGFLFGKPAQHFATLFTYCMLGIVAVYILTKTVKAICSLV